MNLQPGCFDSRKKIDSLDASFVGTELPYQLACFIESRGEFCEPTRTVRCAYLMR